MNLYRLTKEQYYLDHAAQYAQVVMSCQQLERRKDWSLPLHGFFYESQDKTRILEYFHRSDEQLMIEGLHACQRRANAQRCCAMESILPSIRRLPVRYLDGN